MTGIFYVIPHEVTYMMHGCMVYTEHAETVAVSCGTSHVTTKQCCEYTTLVDIRKRHCEKLVTHSESHVI